MPVTGQSQGALPSGARSQSNVLERANKLYSEGQVAAGEAFRLVQAQLDQIAGSLRNPSALPTPLIIKNSSGAQIGWIGDGIFSQKSYSGAGFSSLWVGQNPSTAQLYVDASGNVHMTNAEITLVNGNNSITLNSAIPQIEILNGTSGFEITLDPTNGIQITGAVGTLSASATGVIIAAGSATLSATASGLAMSGGTFSLTDGGVTTTIGALGFSVATGSTTFEVTPAVMQFAGSTGEVIINADGSLSVTQTGPANTTSIAGAAISAETLLLGPAGTGIYFQNLTAATATAGTATLPASPVGFLVIRIGATNYKIPYYAN